MNLKEFAKSLNGRKFYSAYGPLYEGEYIDNCFNGDIVLVTAAYDPIYQYRPSITITSGNIISNVCSYKKRKKYKSNQCLIIDKTKYNYKSYNKHKKYDKFSSEKIVINIHYIGNISCFDTNIDHEKFYLLNDNDELMCIGLMFNLNQ